MMKRDDLRCLLGHYAASIRLRLDMCRALKTDGVDAVMVLAEQHIERELADLAGRITLPHLRAMEYLRNFIQRAKLLELELLRERNLRFHRQSVKIFWQLGNTALEDLRKLPLAGHPRASEVGQLIEGFEANVVDRFERVWQSDQATAEAIVGEIKRKTLPALIKRAEDLDL
jgi:hypothetical protein